MIATAEKLIVDWYKDKTAKRSGVPLMNHIREGVAILREIGANDDTIAAYMLHPLFQNDEDLMVNRDKLSLLNKEVASFVIAYRIAANAYLSGKITKESNGDLVEEGRPILSPFVEVNNMLIADKVQNRKDFLAYHFGTHARSDELDHYFKLWLVALGITEERYNELVKVTC